MGGREWVGWLGVQGDPRTLMVLAMAFVSGVAGDMDILFRSGASAGSPPMLIRLHVPGVGLLLFPPPRGGAGVPPMDMRTRPPLVTGLLRGLFSKRRTALALARCRISSRRAAVKVQCLSWDEQAKPDPCT